MLPLFHLHVATLEDRHELLPRIHDAVCDAGAWVTNFQRLSEASVCLELDVAVRNLPAVHRALRGIGLNVEPDESALLAPLHGRLAKDPEDSIPGTLLVKFIRVAAPPPSL